MTDVNVDCVHPHVHSTKQRHKCSLSDYSTTSVWVNLGSFVQVTCHHSSAFYFSCHQIVLSSVLLCYSSPFFISPSSIIIWALPLLSLISLGTMLLLTHTWLAPLAKICAPACWLAEEMEPIYATGMAAKLRSQWDRNEGLGQNDNAVKYLGQDFESLKASCLQSRCLFQDDTFPAQASSLGFNELGPFSSKTHGVCWMRPPVRHASPSGAAGGMCTPLPGI